MERNRLFVLVSGLSNVITFIYWVFKKQFIKYDYTLLDYIKGKEEGEFSYVSPEGLMNQSDLESYYLMFLALILFAAAGAIVSAVLILSEKNLICGKYFGLFVPISSISICLFIEFMPSDVTLASFYNYHFSYVMVLITIIGAVIPFVLLKDNKKKIVENAAYSNELPANGEKAILVQSEIENDNIEQYAEDNNIENGKAEDNIRDITQF